MSEACVNAVEGDETEPRWFVVSYTWVAPDEHSFETAAWIEARSEEQAVEFFTEVYVEMDAREVWGYAEDWGCNAEHAGDGMFYMSTCCDCGDEGCEAGEHDSQTVCVHVNGVVATYDTREELVKSTEYTRYEKASVDASAVDYYE